MSLPSLFFGFTLSIGGNVWGAICVKKYSKVWGYVCIKSLRSYSVNWCYSNDKKFWITIEVQVHILKKNKWAINNQTNIVQLRITNFMYGKMDEKGSVTFSSPNLLCEYAVKSRRKCRALCAFNLQEASWFKNKKMAAIVYYERMYYFYEWAFVL